MTLNNPTAEQLIGWIIVIGLVIIFFVALSRALPRGSERGTSGATILGTFPLLISLAAIATIVVFILPITGDIDWDQRYRYVALVIGLLISTLIGVAVVLLIGAKYATPASANSRVYGEVRARWEDLNARLAACCPPEPAPQTDLQTWPAQFAAWLAAQPANPNQQTVPTQFAAWLAARAASSPEPETWPAQFAAWLAAQSTPNPDEEAVPAQFVAWLAAQFNADTVRAQITACATARAHACFVGTELGVLPRVDGDPSSGRQATGGRWVLGTGFIDLWAHLHRAEEALFLVQPEAEVVGNGAIDEMRLKDSGIDNSTDYLDKLRWAVATLGGGKYLSGSPPLPTLTEVDQTPQAKHRARVILGGVRRVINEYRDARREGLVRARNQLLWTGTVTGLAAYTLLAMAVLTVPDGWAGREAIIAAAAFFLVGAVVGLFDQLRRGSGTETAPEEDYGLARARLLYIPLLSGLAAVGGVLVTAMLYGTLNDTIPPNEAAAATPAPAVVVAAAATPSATAVPAAAATPPAGVREFTPDVPAAGVREFTPDVPALDRVFDLQDNRFSLVIAAVFGLTPGLLVERLQNQATRYTSELQSTSAQSIRH
jgi:hypothetical protein